MKLLTVRRASQFSPGRHQENDRAILEGTAAVLRRRGWTVLTLAEDELTRAPLPRIDAIVSMCQGPEANAFLAREAQRGTLVINHPEAVQNCYRARLHRALRGHWGVFAPTVLLPTQVARSLSITRLLGKSELAGAASYWVKRGDVHATGPADVVRVRSDAELRAVLAGFAARGIPEAVVGRHLEGEVVKFYGVVDSPFFRYYGERDAKIVPLAFGAARAQIEMVVRRVGLEIYGGDAVIGHNGEVRLIDLNDWPSFASFRAEAAEAIGQHIHARVCEYLKDLQPERRFDVAQTDRGSV